MTEILGEMDGAPERALTLTDLVFKRCRDFWFGVVLLVQSISLTTRFVCVEISQSNISQSNNRMTYFSWKRAYTMSIHLLFTVAYSLLIIRILLSPHTLSRWDSSEFWAVSKEKLNVKSISSKIGRQFWNNLSCFPVCSPDHSNPFLFRLKYRLRSCVKSLSDLANTGIRGLCLVDLNLT